MKGLIPRAVTAVVGAGLALGFITLIVGELRSQAEFGLLAAITLVIAWLLDLTFTPALARRYGLARVTAAADRKFTRHKPR